MKSDKQVSEKPNAKAYIEKCYQLNRLGKLLPRTKSPVPDKPCNVEVKRRAGGKSDKLQDLNRRHKITIADTQKNAKNAVRTILAFPCCRAYFFCITKRLRPCRAADQLLPLSLRNPYRTLLPLARTDFPTQIAPRSYARAKQDPLAHQRRFDPQDLTRPD